MLGIEQSFRVKFAIREGDSLIRHSAAFSDPMNYSIHYPHDSS